MTPNKDNKNIFISIAPMEGVFDHLTRELLCQLGGYDQCVTEFVRVTSQLIPPKVFYRYSPELKNKGLTTTGVPVYIQLLGGNPTPMAENAQIACELGAPGIDINFGCPAKTVNRHDGGATLLKKPERLFNIISAIRKAVPDHIPVTSKVRLGFEDKILCRDIAQASGDGGAARLTVHARTKKEGYKPPAHWEYIARMKDSTHIPVIANGDIWTYADYLECKSRSDCAHIALGRPAFARPDLANIIRANIEKTDYSPLTGIEVIKNILIPFGISYMNTHEERHAVNRTKQWLKYLGQSYPLFPALFNQLKRLKTLNEIHSGLLIFCKTGAIPHRSP